MPFNTVLIEKSVARYRRERDRYSKLADHIAEICRTDICEGNAIRAQVTFRVKSVKSLEGKLNRFSLLPDKNYKTDDDVFASISDLAGVRIATYRDEDCETIKTLVEKFFSDEDRPPTIIDVKDLNKQNPNKFYRAIHAQVWLPQEELVGTYENLDDVSCEIQICSMMAHVWNEIEHDIGYKPGAVHPSEEEIFLLRTLGQNVRLGDEFISRLLAAHENHVDQQEGNFRDVHDFVSNIQRQFDLKSPASNSGQLFEQLKLLSLSTPQSMQLLVAGTDKSALQTEIEEFNKTLGDKTVLHMDPESSDLLLMALFRKKLQDVLATHQGRVGRGMGRPSRLYRLARCYQRHHDGSS